MSVLPSFPRYFYCSYSMPTAGQFLDYIEFQKKLINLLNPKLRKEFKMRLYPYDYGWNALDRFTDIGMGENIEGNNQNLFSRIQECRLCVVPNNATVFLETFTANFPTLLFWNPEYYELRESAQPYYSELHKVGILHYSAESASKLLNIIYENPLKWWMQENIQSAKDQFCKKYAYVNKNWLDEWTNELLSD